LILANQWSISGPFQRLPMRLGVVAWASLPLRGPFRLAGMVRIIR
ncbi:uncharacterized protein METZ01_LOCUS427528, partial [marine metagenome]